MNPLEFQKFILNLEDKFEVQNLVVDDNYVWPILKVHLSSLLFNESKNFATKKVEREEKNDFLFKTICLLVFLYKSIWISFSNFKKLRVLTLSLGQYDTMIGNKAFNRHMDSLGLILDDIRLIKLQFSNGVDNKIPRLFDTLNVDSLFSLASLPLIRLQTDFKLNQVLSQIENMHNGFRAEIFLKKLKKILLMKRLFKSFLKILYRPKVVIISNYYSDIGFALVLACKEEKIKVFDLQHGVISPNHFAYGYWKNNEVLTSIPDGFLVWSKNEEKIINDWKSSSIEVKVLGNMWLTTWANKYRSKSFIAPFSQEPYFKVLFSAQYPDLPRVLFKIIQECKEKVRWLIRLHPTHSHMLSLVLSSLKEEGVLDYCEVNISTHSPLPELLQNIDTHVTESSTVAIEAALFGVGTFFLDSESLTTYSSFLDKETMFKFENSQEFMNELGKVKGSKKELESNFYKIRSQLHAWLLV